MLQNSSAMCGFDSGFTAIKQTKKYKQLVLISEWEQYGCYREELQSGKYDVILLLHWWN